MKTQKPNLYDNDLGDSTVMLNDEDTFSGIIGATIHHEGKVFDIETLFSQATDEQKRRAQIIGWHDENWEDE